MIGFKDEDGIYVRCENCDTKIYNGDKCCRLEDVFYCCDCIWQIELNLDGGIEK